MAILIEVLAQVSDALAGLGSVAGAMTNMQHANQDASGALGVFGVSLTALDNPLTLVANTVKDSIDADVNWANTVAKMAAASGQTTEATSTMGVVFQDFGLNIDGLDKMVKQFTKNGLEFNMATIQKLAGQYQMLTDPVARNEFAFKNFGRSALEMNDILSATPDKLAKLAEQAQYSGKIMSEQDVKAAKDYQLALNQLGTEVDGLKVQIGKALVPELLGAIDGFKNVVKVVESVDIAIMAHTGVISWDQATAREAAVANGDLAGAFHDVSDASVKILDPLRLAAAANTANTAVINSLIDARKQDIDSLHADQAASVAAAQAQDALAKGIAAAKTSTDAAATSNETMSQSLSHLTQTSLGSAAIAELTKAMQAGKISSEDFTTATNKIGLATGLMTPQGVAASSAIQTLTAALNTGRISPEQYAAGVEKIPAAIKGGVIPSLTDLATPLKNSKTDFEDASHGSENMGVSLSRLTGAMPTTLTAVERLTGALPTSMRAMDVLKGSNDAFYTSLTQTSTGALPTMQGAVEHLTGAMPTAMQATNALKVSTDAFYTSLMQTGTGALPTMQGAIANVTGAMPTMQTAFQTLRTQGLDPVSIGLAQVKAGLDALPTSKTITINVQYAGDAAAIRAVQQNGQVTQGTP